MAVIHDALHDRLPQTLCDSAMDLALQTDRVDDRTDIVDDDIGDDFDLAGLRVDFDLADMAAVRGGRVGGGKGAGFVQPALETRRQFPDLERCLRNLGDRYAAVGAGDDKSA